MKSAVLHAAILEILAERDDPAPERYIILTLSVEYGIKVTLSDLQDALHRLEDTKHVIGVRRRDESVVWGVSPLGKVCVAEFR